MQEEEYLFQCFFGPLFFLSLKILFLLILTPIIVALLIKIFAAFNAVIFGDFV